MEQKVKERKEESNTNNVSLAAEKYNNSMIIQQNNIIEVEPQIESFAIEKKNIVRIRELCQIDVKDTFPIAEICLSASSLFAGAIISAMIAGIPFESNLKGIILYSILPAISLGCFLYYLFKRKEERETIKTLANHILEYLPDKKYFVEKENDNK